MSNPIEEANRQQRNYWRGLLIAFFLLIGALNTRYLFGTTLRESGLNSQPIGIALLAGSIALLLTLLCLCLALFRLSRRVAADPHLREALIDDDLIKLHIAHSWKAGFIGAVATPFAYLVIAAIYPFNDLLQVALMTACVGAGAFLVSYYVKSYK